MIQHFGMKIVFTWYHADKHKVIVFQYNLFLLDVKPHGAILLLWFANMKITHELNLSVSSFFEEMEKWNLDNLETGKELFNIVQSMCSDIFTLVYGEPQSKYFFPM